ncbi:AMED_5909 family protein [Amycolatopsis sp. EV170708-02-1]|uniref:AMED_5909 family protein n=1 Tax=Amycolatopsis sp. EV170708-02-1 TaxID=2919322 RepID=UPI001F0BBACB|nr:AMED_5909 family protein [Amycolatopsis sp. EV170708-02-1]UMP03309.1 hypothetical protein MJQ72_00020 [Amycolatopsis sp. EV170708-02-1]
MREGFGPTWVISRWDEATVEETGSSPESPPALVLSGTAGLLLIRPPGDRSTWPDRAAFLRRLRDCADELAALLESRARNGVCDDYPGRNEPQTLKDAHHVAASTRPLPGSNLATWLKWRQANAKMYRAVSDVDRFHHHEIRYWVAHEEDKAEELAARIAKEKAETR